MIVADNIMMAKAKQKRLDVKKDKIVTNNIAIVKSKQRKTDNRNEKIAIDNIALVRAKSEASLEENYEWIKHIAKTSFDVMWDWNIATRAMYVGRHN